MDAREVLEAVPVLVGEFTGTPPLGRLPLPTVAKAAAQGTPDDEVPERPMVRRGNPYHP